MNEWETKIQCLEIRKSDVTLWPTKGKRENTNDNKTTMSKPAFTSEMKTLHTGYIKGLDSTVVRRCGVFCRCFGWCDTRDSLFSQTKESFEYWATEHLRVSGAYWALAAMDVMKALDEMDKAALVDWVVRCQHPSGALCFASRRSLARAHALVVAVRKAALAATKVTTNTCCTR